MSALPPGALGPILQTDLVQRQVSQVRDGERTARANADRQQNFAITETDTTVETTDTDTRVHTDAEGGGSQGRAFSQPEENQQPQEEAPPPQPDGIHGGLIDLEA